MFSLLMTHLSGQVYKKNEPFAHTYSIVAYDPATGEMGVAVQSHWFQVGPIVVWGKSGVGVVATQSFADPSYGPKGIALMEQGIPADDALRILLEQDEGEAVRQIAFLDAKGSIGAHTGKNCIEAAGDQQGKTYSVQANMMLKETVWPAMAKAFEKAKGSLAERMIAALMAAEAEGGDIRGKQSAALIVVHGKPVEGEWMDKIVDLRVDDHPTPLAELNRLFQVHRAYQHMNAGDLAVEKEDMKKAMTEYNAAMDLYPENEEMKYWTAVTLTNTGQAEKALPLFRSVFEKNDNWKKLTPRIIKNGLLKANQATLDKILK